VAGSSHEEKAATFKSARVVLRNAILVNDLNSGFKQPGPGPPLLGLANL